MHFQKNKSLDEFNTFGIKCKAKYFIEINSIDDLQRLYKEKLFVNEKTLILGGGSNILLTGDFEGLIIKNNIKGVDIIFQDNEHVDLKIGAGENWHELVMSCVEQNWGGIENLSLIPGNSGTAPMQNIGAYGAEIKETFISLNAFEISTGKLVQFSNQECKFGYRESIFKNEKKNQYIILNINLRLKKNPTVNVDYGDIREVLEKNKIESPTIKDVSNAIISIRQRKLPDPKKIGNSGSFFKNPIISNKKLKAIKINYPEIVHYKISEKEVKIAAGWLIEQAGWKGRTFENYGVHKNQALVLVNYGGAKGKDIFELSQKIIQDIKEKFDIELIREVNII